MGIHGQMVDVSGYCDYDIRDQHKMLVLKIINPGKRGRWSQKLHCVIFICNNPATSSEVKYCRHDYFITLLNTHNY